MVKSKKSKKKLKKRNKGKQTKIVLEENMDDYEGATFLDKAGVKMIYNALREYKPSEDEELVHSVILEEFEEILVVDYGEPYPDAN